MQLPIFNTLKAYSDKNPISFHMPGHKGGKLIGEVFESYLLNIDLTEIAETDNLHYPSGIIEKAQKLAAKAFNAKQTFFLVNGSTCGIHAMIMSACGKGDKLIVDRNCHKSVINGLFLAGAEPVYIFPEINEEYGIPTSIMPQIIEDAIKKNPEAKGVLITSPNYYGVCSNINEIATVVHKYNKILMIDEAHGAHLNFSDRLPSCAMKSGADICVQSAHKTLPALTQASYLHVNSERIDFDKVAMYLRILQSSSPSYILMSSLDIARAIMEECGEKKLYNLLELIDNFIEKVHQFCGISILNQNDIPKGEIDRTRLVINVQKLNIRGYEAEKFLSEKHNIQVEMSDLHNLICICTVANSKEDFDNLFNALMDLCKVKRDGEKRLSHKCYLEMKPTIKVNLGEAMRAESTQINIDDALGKIATDAVVPYPPGVPIICPGEEITGESIEYIKRVIEIGGNINGISDKLLIRVIK